MHNEIFYALKSSLTPLQKDHARYGLKIAQISSKKLGDSREGKLANPYLYNGKELLDEDMDLGWYDYGFRDYDPQIGRFVEMDPITDAFPEWSGYVYSGNDPITNTDVDGLGPTDVLNVANVTVTQLAKGGYDAVVTFTRGLANVTVVAARKAAPLVLNTGKILGLSVHAANALNHFNTKAVQDHTYAKPPIPQNVPTIKHKPDLFESAVHWLADRLLPGQGEEGGNPEGGDDGARDDAGTQVHRKGGGEIETSEKGPGRLNHLEPTADYVEYMGKIDALLGLMKRMNTGPTGGELLEDLQKIAPLLKNNPLLQKFVELLIKIDKYREGLDKAKESIDAAKVLPGNEGTKDGNKGAEPSTKPPDYIKTRYVPSNHGGKDIGRHDVMDESKPDTQEVTKYIDTTKRHK